MVGMTDCPKCALVGQVHDPSPSRCQGHVKNTSGKGATPAGHQCPNAPRTGLNVCGYHGINERALAAGKRNVERAQLERTVTQQIRDLGELVDIRDGEALIAMRGLAAAKVIFYRRMVDDLADSDLYGELYHVSGQATGEAKPHVLVVMLNDERDRLAKLDEICVKLGFDERRLRVAEAEIGMLFDAVTRAAQVLPAELRDTFRRALADAIRTPVGAG